MATQAAQHEIKNIVSQLSDLELRAAPKRHSKSEAKVDVKRASLLGQGSDADEKSLTDPLSTNSSKSKRQSQKEPLRSQAAQPPERLQLGDKTASHHLGSPSNKEHPATTDNIPNPLLGNRENPLQTPPTTCSQSPRNPPLMKTPLPLNNTNKPGPYL